MGKFCQASDFSLSKELHVQNKRIAQAYGSKLIRFKVAKKY